LKWKEVEHEEGKKAGLGDFWIVISLWSIMAPLAAGEAITLNVVSFAPAANVVEFQYIKKELFERINQLAKGQLTIMSRVVRR